jgi:tetratricopeptide (TPR) repeat protein
MLGSVLIYGLHLEPGYAARSEQALQEALRISPALQTAYFQLAQLYLSTGRQDRAFESIRQAWALDRTSTEAGAKLWQTAIMAGRADVVSEARAALDVKRLGEADLYRIALAYHLVEDFAEALTFYDRLVEVKPGNARYRASRAAILAHFGRIEEARREAREAARLDPGLAEEAGQFLGTLTQP